jgi:hypothetical protein
MENKTNGACDEDNFNWKTGEQGEAARYLRPAALPITSNGDAAKYVRSTGELTDIKPVKRLGSIEVRKPKKSEWFRAHPKMIAEIFVIKRESTGDFYAVDPGLAGELADEIREAYLVACVSDEGALFLWPILKTKSDGSGIQLFESDLEDLSLSRAKWIRRQWSFGSKSYKVDEADTDKVPEWPETEDIAEWVSRAFRGRLIDDLNHQLVRRLRGEL